VAHATPIVEQPHRNPWASALTALPLDVADSNGCYMETSRRRGPSVAGPGWRPMRRRSHRVYAFDWDSAVVLF
jgi:hypothetical protein